MLHFVARLRSQGRRFLSLSKAAVRLALLCPLMGILCVHSSAQYNTGLPTVGNAGAPKDSQTFIDAKQFLGGSVTDMCGAIAAACGQLHASGYPNGATIDARGFTGTQVCSGSLTTTTMLNACVTGTNHNGGKLLLGNVNLYIDGPTSGNYSDGTSGIGTPAIIIPSFFWGIEGVSRGASANGSNAGLGTFISPCPSTNPPQGCGHPFPLRSFLINSTTVALPVNGVTTMTITLPAPVTSGTNIYPGELGMVKGDSVAGENGTFKIQSITNSGMGSTGTITVTVPSGTLPCSLAPPQCGTLFLGTPIVGFGGSMSYNTLRVSPGPIRSQDEEIVDSLRRDATPRSLNGGVRFAQSRFVPDHAWGSLLPTGP